MPDALDRLGIIEEPEALDTLDMSELRERRGRLQETEQALSYVRRLVQVRLDIVVDEREHRAGGAGPRDPAALVAELPKILSEHATGMGRGSFSDVVTPAAVEAVVAELERVLDVASLGSLPTMSDDQLAAAAEWLVEMERRISQNRRALHAAIDALQAEMVRRYKTGVASVDAVLQQPGRP